MVWFRKLRFKAKALWFKVKAARRLGCLGLIFPVDWMAYAELSYLFAVPPIFATLLRGDNPVAEYVGELARIYNNIVLARVWEGCGKKGEEVDTAPLEEAAKKLAEFLRELGAQGGAAKVAAEILGDVALTYTDEVEKAVRMIAGIEDDEGLKRVSERIAQLRLSLREALS
jgi:hypothetical protein